MLHACIRQPNPADMGVPQMQLSTLCGPSQLPIAVPNMAVIGQSPYGGFRPITDRTNRPVVIPFGSETKRCGARRPTIAVFGSASEVGVERNISAARTNYPAPRAASGGYSDIRAIRRE